PVQHLFGQPVQALLPRVRHLGQAHLRNGHLRNVDEGFNVALFACSRGRDDSRLEVGWRDTQPEVDTPAALHRPNNISRRRQVADTAPAPGFAQPHVPLILSRNLRADRYPSLAQALDAPTSDPAYAPSRSRH